MSPKISISPNNSRKGVAFRLALFPCGVQYRLAKAASKKHASRYYASWLGRWTAADPAGLVDGVNLYVYCRGNPVKLWDPDGNAGTSLLANQKDLSGAVGVAKYFRGDTVDRFPKDKLGSIVSDIRENMRKAGINVRWIRKAQKMLKDIKFEFKPENPPASFERIVRSTEIFFNITINAAGSYIDTRCERGLQAVVIHELRHIWQTQSRKWKDKTGGGGQLSDVSMEVDAFDIQFAYERSFGINPPHNIFRAYFERIEEIDFSNSQWLEEFVPNSTWISTLGLSNQERLKEFVLWYKTYSRHDKYTNLHGWCRRENLGDDKRRELSELFEKLAPNNNIIGE